MNRVIFTISAIIFALDQISKSIITSILDIGQNIEVIKDLFYITLVHNYGAAWSILEKKVSIIIIGTFLALILIYRYMYLFDMNKRNMLAFGLLTGGIIGNLADRVLSGYVIDFINIYIGSYDFPVFNISDMAIVFGVILLIYAIFKGEDTTCKK